MHSTVDLQCTLDILPVLNLVLFLRSSGAAAVRILLLLILLRTSSY